MKKIGILTFHRANNFGAVLQNFALQRAIEKCGFYSETIDYRIPEIEKWYKYKSSFVSRHPIQLLKRKFWEFLNYSDAKLSFEKFDDFRKYFLNVSEREYDYTNINQADYDIFVSGSDQIWSRGIVGDLDADTFFLLFTEKKKAAYAASCGNVSAISDSIDKVKTLDIVTVREDDLQVELQNNEINAKLVCDPTILLSRNEWQNMIKDVAIDHTNYVYLYYIDSGRGEAAKIAKSIAEKNESKVYFSKKRDAISVKHKYGVSKFSDGPLDFLKEIESANFVVVSSFHGVVFSLLFEKQFVALLHRETGNRVESLLRQVGLEDRIVKDFDDFFAKSKKLQDIDYSIVNPIIDEWRKQSFDELRKICSL